MEPTLTEKVKKYEDMVQYVTQLEQVLSSLEMFPDSLEEVHSLSLGWKTKESPDYEDDTVSLRFGPWNPMVYRFLLPHITSFLKEEQMRLKEEICRILLEQKKEVGSRESFWDGLPLSDHLSLLSQVLPSDPPIEAPDPPVESGTFSEDPGLVIQENPRQQSFSTTIYGGNLSLKDVLIEWHEKTYSEYEGVNPNDPTPTGSEETPTEE